MSNFNEIRFDKRFGTLTDIILDVQEVLAQTGIATGVFEFNGKEVYVNLDTELNWGNIVLKAVQNPNSKKIIDIRG